MKIKEKWCYKIEIENNKWYKKYIKISDIWVLDYKKIHYEIFFGVWDNWNSKEWLGFKS